jgi:hypothetical protein
MYSENLEHFLSILECVMIMVQPNKVKQQLISVAFSIAQLWLFSFSNVVHYTAQCTTMLVLRIEGLPKC